MIRAAFPRRLLSRAPAAVALSLAGALALGTAPASAAAARPDADPLARYHHQHLHWKSCRLGPDDATGKELDRAGAQCADVTVPLDYARPDGRTITVAISRIRGTDTAHRVGALLLNSGGPGGQTLGDPPWVRAAMKDVAARYDVVGVDPRFVGRSTTLDCHWPTGSMIRGAGTGRAAFDRVVALSADLARRCRTHAGDLLPYATTRNTARDMDVIRAALGERRISYLGYSYGTYLGQVYATMFPRRTDRVVLDGVADPARYGPRLLRGTEEANRHALRDWADWTAAHHAAYGLGRTGSAVLAAVEAVRSASARTPLRVGGYRVDDHVLPVVVFNGLSQDNPTAYGDFARGVRDLRRAAEGRRVTPSPWLASALEFTLTGHESAYGSAQTSTSAGTWPRRVTRRRTGAISARWKAVPTALLAAPATANTAASSITTVSCLRAGLPDELRALPAYGPARSRAGRPESPRTASHRDRPVGVRECARGGVPTGARGLPAGTRRVTWWRGRPCAGPCPPGAGATPPRCPAGAGPVPGGCRAGRGPGACRSWRAGAG
ncbi:hypothetical protein SCANM63S_03803 [Streptomyces canarius]